MCTMVPTRPIGRFSSGRSDGSTRDRSKVWVIA
jgi:hypothetical protein